MTILIKILFFSSLSLLIGCTGGFSSLNPNDVDSIDSPSSSNGNSNSESSPNSQPPPTTDSQTPGRNISNLNVFFMGHSLVGHDIPQLVEQFSESHSVPASYNYQIGWGTSMNYHWDYYTNGTEFAGLFTGDSNFRPAHEALQSQQYNVYVMTEMVEIIHAVKYRASETHGALWAQLAEQRSPNTQVYLYETWPSLDVSLQGDENHPEYTNGRHNDYWLNKIEFDHNEYWKNRIYNPMLNATTSTRPLMIPAGQVVKEFVILLENTTGGIGGITQRQQLFSDMIHLSPLGTYLVSLAQISTILDRSPCNLPQSWVRDNGSTETPSLAAAQAMKSVVKRVLADNRDITGVTFSNQACQ